MGHFMTPRELRDSGLLQHINQTVLWPLGLALVISIDPDDPDDTGYLNGVQEMGDVIASGDTRDEANAQADRLSAFMRDRLNDLLRER